MDVKELVEKQREFFLSGGTASVDERRRLLKRLKEAVKENEELVLDALKLDLGKPRFEAYVSEVLHFYSEVDYAVSHIKRWSRPRRRLTPLLNLPAASYTYRQPYGVVLILSPWNYPFDLAMVPLVYAVAAGNTVVLKPSEVSENTSRILSRLIKEVFDERHVAVVEGGPEVAKGLLEERFDYIFYTGNPTVGRYVMEKASRHLTPVTLELGGKSPAIVCKEKDFELAVKRIVWGKCFNAGQTCIAPDYVLVERGRKEEFVRLFSRWVEVFYGDVRTSPDYGRIVSQRHFDRLALLVEMEKDNVLYGGEMDRDQLFISPTVIDASWDSPSMQEEIFGPVLPVIEFESVDEVVDRISRMPEPLAVYLFTSDAGLRELFMRRVKSGALVCNDCLVHFVSPWLPFGGIGESGMGKYHGRWGFETFTNEKAVVHRANVMDLPVRYPPYKGWKLSFLRRLGRILTGFGI